MISTCRFTDATWRENCIYRERLGHNSGCLYGVPMKMTETIPLNTLVFVVEMNNTTNRIEGIGLIRNFIEHGRFNIYPSSGNHTRYIYKGKYRVSREVLERYNPQLVEILELLCFKGYMHLKRGNGFMRMTEKILTQPRALGIDFMKEIYEIFTQEREKSGGEEEKEEKGEKEEEK